MPTATTLSVVRALVRACGIKCAHLHCIEDLCAARTPTSYAVCDAQHAAPDGGQVGAKRSDGELLRREGPTLGAVAAEKQATSNTSVECIALCSSVTENKLPPKAKLFRLHLRSSPRETAGGPRGHGAWAWLRRSPAILCQRPDRDGSHARPATLRGQGSWPSPAKQFRGTAGGEYLGLELHDSRTIVVSKNLPNRRSQSWIKPTPNHPSALQRADSERGGHRSPLSQEPTARQRDDLTPCRWVRREARHAGPSVRVRQLSWSKVGENRAECASMHVTKPEDP